MIEEYRLIMKNNLWEIVLRPENKSVMTSKWIYNIKHVAYGNIKKHKARFIARGFSQKEDIEYKETFSPVVRYTSIRTILALAPVMKWKIQQMDVNTTFLNGVVKEEVYVEQPLGFKTHDRKTHG